MGFESPFEFDEEGRAGCGGSSDSPDLALVALVGAAKEGAERFAVLGVGVAVPDDGTDMFTDVSYVVTVEIEEIDDKDTLAYLGCSHAR